MAAAAIRLEAPAGAFIVLMAATAAQFGLNGLLPAVVIFGLVLSPIDASGSGSLIRCEGPDVKSLE